MVHILSKISEKSNILTSQDGFGAHPSSTSLVMTTVSYMHIQQPRVRINFNATSNMLEP